jgi:hypothetical protein
MSSKLPWVIPGGVALAFGLVLGWQRLELGPLQAELEMLRDRASEGRQLRAERERLRAQRVPEGELERLRADRAAIARMKGEVAAVRTSAETKERMVAVRKAERFAVGQRMPAAVWKNAGAASPVAALETVLWAAAGGDVDVFARRIHFDAAGRKAMQALWEGLPPAERVRHASPEHLLAFLSIKDVPVGTALVSAWKEKSNTVQGVSLALSAQGEKARTVTLVLQRDGEEWKLLATEAAVARYAAALRGPPVAVDGK